MRKVTEHYKIFVDQAILNRLGNKHKLFNFYESGGEINITVDNVDNKKFAKRDIRNNMFRLPKGLYHECGIKAGDSLYIFYNPETKSIILRKP